MDNNVYNIKRKRIEWDIHESVLLLNALISIYEKGKNKKEVIIQLSQFLRQRAILHGLDIDEIFRNENGIPLQLEMMLYYYSDKQSGMENGSKLFEQTCYLYKNSPEEYSNILLESQKLPISFSILKENFFYWLSKQIDSEKLSSLSLCYDILDEYCKNQKTFYKSLYCLTNLNEISNLVNLLRDDRILITQIKQVNKNFVESLQYVIRYINHTKKITNNKIENNTSQTAVNNIAYKNSSNIIEENNISPLPNPIGEELKLYYIKTLEEAFPHGLIYNNKIQFDKFKILLNASCNNSLFKEKNNETLLQELLQIGIKISNKIYSPSKFANNPLLNEINTTINNTLQSNTTDSVSVIFSICLFNRYADRLAQELNIYNAEDLLPILQYINPQINITKEIIYLDTTKKDYSYDVLKAVKNNDLPITYKELEEKLWYIPIEKIKYVLNNKKFPELINIDKETYFSIHNFFIESNELTKIIHKIQNELEQEEYILSKNLPNLLKQVSPAFVSNCQEYSSTAMHEILKYFLKDYFTFTPSIICKKDNTINIGKLYRNFCKNSSRISIESLKEFSDTLKTPIYWNDVFSEMIRISKDELIHKDMISFDCNAIDNIINMQCINDYLPLHEATLFLHLPQTEFPWNGFLLESYLLNYSQQFSLFQTSISEKNFYGIIVKKSSQFKKYSDILIDYLAHSSEWNNKESAINLIVDKKFQATRKINDIETIIQKAQMLKNEIEEKGI